jgi:hypothetical protein
MANCPPKTPPTGCLDVTIQESIILPNYNLQESYNTFTVCGINNYVTRTEVIDYNGVVQESVLLNLLTQNQNKLQDHL